MNKQQMQDLLAHFKKEKLKYPENARLIYQGWIEALEMALKRDLIK